MFMTPEELAAARAGGAVEQTTETTADPEAHQGLQDVLDRPEDRVEESNEQIERVWYTPLARLLGAGWAPPDDELVALIRRREALWSAMAELTEYTRQPAAIEQAVEAGDRDALVQAVIAQAIAAWCDTALERFAGEAQGWDVGFRNAISRRVAADPAAVLASLEAVDSLDAAGLRAEAEGYLDVLRRTGASYGTVSTVEPTSHSLGSLPRRVQALGAARP
jgi:hypothetical protein